MHSVFLLSLVNLCVKDKGRIKPSIKSQHYLSKPFICCMKYNHCVCEAERELFSRKHNKYFKIKQETRGNLEKIDYTC